MKIRRFALGVARSNNIVLIPFENGKNLAFEIDNVNKKILNCKKVNTNGVIGLENSANTPNEILEIYKKYKLTQLAS